jgi:predicted transcriptional regulator
MASTSIHRPALEADVGIQQMLEALQHEYRRQILKVAVEVGKPVSPKMASRTIRLPLKITSNHFRFLHRKGLLTLEKQVPRRGATETFYVLHPNVLGNPVLRAVLDAI